MSLTDLLYIAGYGRSGSTLLDILLNAHPDIFGAGELTNLFRPWFREFGLCSCGKRVYGDCPLWTPVLQELSAQLPLMTFNEMDRITQRYESIINRTPGMGCGGSNLYHAIWSTVFTSIRRQTGARMIVDSSKTSLFGNPNRIRALSHIWDNRLWMIHLIRDPQAVAYSRYKGNNRVMEMGSTHQDGHPIVRTVLGWMTANAIAEMHRAYLPAARSYLLRYEDLVEKHAYTLAALSRWIGIDLSDVAEQLHQGKDFAAGHGIAGNRMRRTGAITLKANDKWGTHLSRPQRLLLKVTVPYAKRYGYAV